VVKNDDEGTKVKKNEKMKKNDDEWWKKTKNE
jgi:hypothetical protein